MMMMMMVMMKSTIPVTAVPSAFYRGSNVSLMITNDIYEGSGSMRTNDPFGYSEVRDRLRESPPGGAATDVGRTAGASPPCGETANCLNQSSQRFIVCLFTARSY